MQFVDAKVKDIKNGNKDIKEVQYYRYVSHL